jgi:hypothetical protein
MWGFDNLKDLLEILIIPFVLLGIGKYLPVLLEEQKVKQRRDDFTSMIRRELEEMSPYPKKPMNHKQWWKHLSKRFIHEQIFMDPSPNRDFILSLDPELAYHEAQLWRHIDKASKPELKKDLEYHAGQWLWHLSSICRYFDSQEKAEFTKEIYESWKNLIDLYHPKTCCR